MFPAPAPGPDAVALPPAARGARFDVRLAASAAERARALDLRRTVFGAYVPDADRFDTFCDHLLVTDRATGALAGTARLLRADAARTGFYAEAEFDVAPLIDRHPHLRFCEVGRSCIAPAYRHGAAMHALWAGLAAYARENAIDVYFGTASFPGTDPARHAAALALLARTARAPADWAVHARTGRAVPMRPDGTPSGAPRRLLPPLLRGYLALGAHVSREAAIDPDFGTIDVLVAARLARAPAAYRMHFSYAPSKGA